MTGLRRRPIVVLGMVALALLAVECTPHRHVHRPKRKRKPKCKTCPRSRWRHRQAAEYLRGKSRNSLRHSCPTTYAVILAGGNPAWPMSRSARPAILDAIDRAFARE